MRYLRQAAEKRIGRIICRSAGRAGTLVKGGLKELTIIKAGTGDSEWLEMKVLESDTRSVGD